VYGDSFKKYRKLALTILKDFGFGQTIMEDRIRAEVKTLFNNILYQNTSMHVHYNYTMIVILV